MELRCVIPSRQPKQLADLLRRFQSRSEQLNELLRVHSGLPDDRAQRTGIKLAVIRDNKLGERLVATQDYVTAVLALDFESRFFSSAFTQSRPESRGSLLIRPRATRQAGRPVPAGRLP